MKRIKVLHISETFAAGVYTYIKDLSKFLDDYKHIDNYVIYSGLREDTDKDRFDNDFPESTKLIEVDMTRNISPLKDLKSLKKLIVNIKNIKPDIIHLHSSKAGVIGRVAAATCKSSKVFYTPHGYSFLRQDVSTNKMKLFRYIEKYTALIFGGTTIACGDTEFDYAKKLGESLLVRNGVKVEEINQFKQENKNLKFTIGTVGRLTFQKNPKLFNEIAKKMPNINFVWIGDGALKHELTSKNIDITGWMAREKVLMKINSFDVYIQTSLWEGLPFTILEAMALEKPIIANNCIGNKDAVKDKYNGFLCEKVDEFIISLQKLKEDKLLREHMSKNSYKRVREIFNKTDNFKRLIEIYSEKLI